MNATHTILSAETAEKTLPELPTDRPVVIYDGQCPLCLRSVAVLKRLDVFGRLAYHDARQPFAIPPTSPPLDPDKLLVQMHVVTPGTTRRRCYGGFYAFRALAWNLPACWPILPLLYLPGAAWVGERIYAWIARNRFRLLACSGKVCRFSPPHHGRA